MGFFSKVGSFIKKATGMISNPVASLIGGGLSFLGGERRNQAASAASQKQMDFQERMSSTAHQREIADLRAAGLNPILSATGGKGASSPVGSQPPLTDIVTPAVSTALQYRRVNQEIDNLEASKNKIDAETQAIKYGFPGKRAEQGYTSWLAKMYNFITQKGEEGLKGFSAWRERSRNNPDVQDMQRLIEEKLGVKPIYPKKIRKKIYIDINNPKVKGTGMRSKEYLKSKGR